MAEAVQRERAHVHQDSPVKQSQSYPFAGFGILCKLNSCQLRLKIKMRFHSKLLKLFYKFRLLLGCPDPLFRRSYVLLRIFFLPLCGAISPSCLGR